MRGHRSGPLFHTEESTGMWNSPAAVRSEAIPAQPSEDSAKNPSLLLLSFVPLLFTGDSCDSSSSPLGVSKALLNQSPGARASSAAALA